MGDVRKATWTKRAVAAMVCGAALVASWQVSAQSDYQAAEKAKCAPGDRPESGLSGLWTAAERFSTPARSFNCNLELVGQYAGEGASWGGASFDACAYIGRNDGPGLNPRGTPVIDVSDPKNPKAVAFLDSPAMIEPNETLRSHAGRKVLAAVGPYYWWETNDVSDRTDSDFDVYDIANCRRPVLKASIKLPHTRSHGADFAPDGRTYYLTSYTGNMFQEGSPQLNRWRNTKTDAVVAIDLSDPARPREIARWTVPVDVGAAHQISISQDGNRAYLSLYAKQFGATVPQANGVAIIDISEIQSRKPNPQVRVISRQVWPDNGGFQGTTEVRIAGRPYLFASGPGGGGKAGCAQGLPSYGSIVVLDLSDATHPAVVSKLMLESGLPRHCTAVVDDAINRGSRGPNFCAVDNPKDTKIMACGFGEAAVRVFDVRNPRRVREIAYYKPPISGTPSKPGSYFSRKSPAMPHTGDFVAVVIEMRRERGELWFMSLDGGFQVARFTDSLRKAEPGLF